MDFNHLGHEFSVISGQFHAQHARHAKPNATGFPIGMPGMPNPMQLASRSAYRACQTQCNWLHDRHARHAKPNATGFPIGMPGKPNPMQLASRSACPACQTQCNWLHDRHARRAKPDEQTGVLPVTNPEKQLPDTFRFQSPSRY